MKSKIQITAALLLALMLALMIGLTACGGAGEQADTESEPQQEEEITANEETGADTLVIYFSATGNTKGVAEKIADVTEADIYEIVPAVPYTDEDLDYGDETTRATAEQNDPDARPEIGGEDVDLSSCSTIFIGYPIWWGQAPRIMDTFAENHDFSGKTVIPFCTSGSSDIGQTGTGLGEKAGSGDWQAGKRFAGGATEDEIRSWIESLEL